MPGSDRASLLRLDPFVIEALFYGIFAENTLFKG